MAMRLIRRSLHFNQRVALVTGAANGLGKEYALELGRRGATVIVNDIGGTVHGKGEASIEGAAAVVDEIKRNGGEAMAVHASVEEADAIIDEIMGAYNRLDIVINNAGILRDRSFLRLTDDDWERIIAVHLTGAYKLSQRAFRVMKEANYGRIINTTSASGLYGNHGQVNYGAAKAGLIGMTKSIAIEGARCGVNCNAVAPIAASRMTRDIFPEPILEMMSPLKVVPLTLYLAHEECDETGSVFETAGGWIGKVQVQSAPGAVMETDTMECVRDKWDDICNLDNPVAIDNVQARFMHVLGHLNK